MKIKLTGISSEIAGKAEIEIEPVTSVKELKEYLISSFPKMSKYAFQVSINSRLANGSTKLNEQDDILVFGAYAGG